MYLTILTEEKTHSKPLKTSIIYSGLSQNIHWFATLHNTQQATFIPVPKTYCKIICAHC